MEVPGLCRASENLHRKTTEAPRVLPQARQVTSSPLTSEPPPLPRCMRPSLDPTQFYRARTRENYNSQSSSRRMLSSINQVVRVR